ncbi:MAG: hypothetical protein R2716_02295 [Microthrixaceae bacterium]
MESQDFETAGQLRDRRRELLATKEEKDAEMRTRCDLFDEVGGGASPGALAVDRHRSTEAPREETANSCAWRTSSTSVVGQRRRRSRRSARPSGAPREPQGPQAPLGFVHLPGPLGRGQDGARQTLAEFLFGDEEAMISLDMSEYMEKHTVS